MDLTPDTIVSLGLGLGLAAACGFRVFVPLLVLSLGARYGYVPLSAGWEWMATNGAVLTFATATVVEVLAYYIPWLDHALDTIATPAAVVAGMVTFAVFLLLWIVDWMSSFVPPPFSGILTALSITTHLDDFTKGVIDTQHLIYYLSFMTFGLFLTAKAVDSERWRG
jgi:hypothetical protein